MFGVEFKWKMFVGTTLACIVILMTTVYRPSSNHVYHEPSPRSLSNLLSWHMDFGNVTKKETKEKITMLAKIIHKAKKHVRGSKTSEYLKTAIFIMNNILKDIDVDAKNVYERSSMKSTSICSESFKGGGFGYPLYYKGFETDHCTNAVPISKLVTVVRYIETKSNEVEALLLEHNKFLSSVYDTIENVSTVIAVDSAIFLNDLKTKYPLVNVIQSKYQSEGSALNILIKHVKTPYVFIARNMNALTHDSRLERLVREIESLNVVAAGGAFRDSKGHWKKGCFQSVYRNYTLKYIEGYDESFHECLFCDYIHGPFVTTTNYLKQNAFQNLNGNNGLYEDWFLRAFSKEKETIVCPDSMFHVTSLSAQTASNWEQFAQNWDLFKILTPDGYTFTWSCQNQKISRRPSQALSPCTLQSNNNAVETIMRICEETGAMCELEDGTVLGAVKLEKVLPWDIDFDIRFLATNCSICQKLERALKRAGVSVSKFTSFCCSSHDEKMSYNSIGYKGYAGDFHGLLVMDSDLLVKASLAPTKVLFDGRWMNAPRNPGMFIRNKYGKEIYQHAEHWRFTGVDKLNQKRRYKTNVFLPCKEPGRHDCLDRYNADGDLSFVAMAP